MNNRRLSLQSLLWTAVALPLLAAAPTLPNEWQVVGSMGVPRAYHTASLLASGKVLVAGGSSNGSILASCELYDPTTNSWSAAASLAVARALHTATILADGKVLVAGGYGASDYLSTAELYDSTTDTWSPAGSMATAKVSHTATLLADGRVLIAGGYINGNYLSSAELYDPSLNTWSAAASMAVGRPNHTANMLSNGKILVAGGEFNGGTFSSAELYDPLVNAWVGVGSMANARSYHTASRLLDGKVMVVGGGLNGGPSGAYSSAELFNPVSGTWSVTGALMDARMFHADCLLPDGRILVVGGYRYTDNITLSSAELYNPATSTWSGAGSLNGARYNHSATSLQDGRILVTGGFQNGQALQTAEVYQPPALVTALAPARVWIGLKNSDDVGIRFDLRAEVYKVSGAVTTLVGIGDLTSVPGGSSGFNNAKLNQIPLTIVGSPSIASGDTLSIKVLVRNAASGSGKNSGTARLWFNDGTADSGFGAQYSNDPTAKSYYLLHALSLGLAVGAGPRETIDVAAGAKGSIFKTFGTWNVTVP